MQLNVDLTQQEDPGLSPEQTMTNWIQNMRMMREMSLLSIISRLKAFFCLHDFCLNFFSLYNQYLVDKV